MRDPIKCVVWHLDVGSRESTKAVCMCEERVHLVGAYVSWVQTDVNQVGPYLGSIVEDGVEGEVAN